MESIISKKSVLNMGDVYENLTRPYDEFDKLKANRLTVKSFRGN